ncbi:hypothetical protein K505DRAFT_259095 [Melanomma pulvis-pyrius CBS 109.77]|uniref:HTH La-type RNA-binding domain-containing protein n=1 Tax=Melanomma pulvis-pyrius CBS 109.77 TaxID=1314802 RepID=A0A6A6WRU1_9PLEO|nr:hypothetical protein K505DRAFT_259095 [Melanomma pulvis-pyrius CBS 109.77]
MVEADGGNKTQANAIKKAETSGGNTASDPEQVAVDEDPDGPQIRRQVEFYFSDENLPTDLHLLQCCGGRENIGVSISRICGFKKMRKWKKKIVAQELRKSAFLDVSADGKTVKRKVPLVGRTLLDPPEEEDEEIAYDPRTKREILLPIPLLPQQKAEYPPGMTKNMMKPSGFEETFTEGPIKPEEAAEEAAMYDPDKPFVERMEIAIQRFKQKRRMHEMYAKVFNKWMRFGGVEAMPRMFGGLSKTDMAEMNSEEIARAMANHNVPWDRGDETQWVVDFVGVGEAFLSSFYPAHYGHAPAQIKTACQVLRTFYNYLMVHNVCEEYRDDLLLARNACNKAEFELTKVYTAGLALPGAFNLAASTIFGGTQAGTFTGDSVWAQDLSMDDIGMREEEARVTFMTGMAVHGTDAQYDMLTHPERDDLSSIRIIQDESVGLEVVSIQLPTDEVKEMYANQNEVYKAKLHLQPLGKLICKAWNIEDFKEYDLPQDRYPNGKLPRADEGKTYEFWVEDGVLTECFEGMKMDARVLTLEGDMVILDEVKEAMCSFWKWLPNELWMERHPRELKYLNKGLEDVMEKAETNNKDMEGVMEKAEINNKDMKGAEMRFVDD